MITLFRNLKPALGGQSPHDKPTEPTWQLSFNCPECGHRTSVSVSGRVPVWPIWYMTPHPVQLVERIKPGEDIAAQWERNFDDVTIEPSMKDLPHARQVNCKAHFSVTRGHIIPG